MKICFDARYLQSRVSGIGRYSRSLIDALLHEAPGHEYHALVHESFVAPEDWSGRIHLQPVPWAPLSAATLFRAGGAIDRLECDVAHVLCPVIPLRLRTPLAVTLYDWQPLTVPDFSGGRPAPLKAAYDLFYRWEYPRAVRRAGWIACSSGATLRETCRRVPGAETRCSVVHAGLDRHFAIPPRPEELEKVRQEYHLPARFVLYVGSTRPNKQLPTLIEAFHGLQMNHPEGAETRLVLVLRPDRFFEPAAELIERLGMSGEVLILEDVPETALPAIYQRAAAVAMATTDEGFGFPVIEALAQGTPLVIAEHGSLPELAGDAALRVPPRDAPALTHALHRLLGEPLLRTRLKITGPPRAALFQWRQAAAQMLEIYRRLATIRS